MAAYGKDCYFFYNSKCLKGDQCKYRHCQEALDSAAVCPFWQQGGCKRKRCPYRHTALRAPIKETICFNEMRGGYIEANCPYKHYKSAFTATAQSVGKKIRGIGSI
jgi:hypothetical protein